MLLKHVKGLLFNPIAEWEKIRTEASSVSQLFAGYGLWLAAIAPVCALIGTTTLGWRIGVGDAVRLTPASAVQMAIAFYLAILMSTFCIGKMIHWMAQTYGANAPLSLCMALALYTATPLFLIGMVQLVPTLWLNFIVGLPALGYTVYLLYAGAPIVMQIPPERAYLFSTSILAVGLVTLVGLLAVTAGLWGIGIGPRFT